MLQSDGAARSVLYVTIRKLKQIRINCGCKDEDITVASVLSGGKHSSGDPFKDACTAFAMVMLDCTELVDDRNDAVKKYGQDRGVIEQSNAILLGFRELDTCLHRIRTLVDESEMALVTAHENGKESQKIALMERQFNERSNTYYQCEAAMKALREKNARRFNSGGGKALLGGGGAQQIRLGAKNAMREQLLSLRRGNGSGPTHQSGGGGGSNMPYGVRNSSGDADSRSSYRRSRLLDEDPATREQMKRIREDDEKIEKGLDNISAGVARLHKIALEIGFELEVQNTRLGVTEEKVDQNTEKLKEVNKRLTKLLKKGRPLNVFINLFCLVVFLGLIGLLLWQLNVV